jgi:ATP-dependent DNA helicase RecG
MATKNPSALLQYLAQQPEMEWIEFKDSNYNPEEIGSTLCAMANAAILQDKDAAYLVFGVEDQSRKFIGTAMKIATQKKGGEDLLNWLSRMLEPRLQIEVMDFVHDEMAFSIVKIEPTYDRPVSFSGTEFIRIGQNVKKLREFPSHERSIWQATSRRKFEHSVAYSNLKLGNIGDRLDIETYFRLQNLPLPRSSDEVAARLCACGILVDDMEGGFHVTNLGAILLARDVSTFPSIASKSVRITGYRGSNKKTSDFEQEGTKGYAVGFEGMMRFIMQRIPKEEKYIDGIRTQIPMIPEIAIREVIANALIHQDFTISGNAPVIEMFADRIEVANPGNSLISIDRLIDERRSRNEMLAKTLRDLGLCEERGGGLDKTIIALEENHLPAFEFISSEQSMRVVLFGPKPFSKLTKTEKLRACFYHCCIKYVNQDFMGNTSLRERFSLPQEEYQAVSSIITESVRSKRIKPAEENQGKKNARYIPNWA